MAPLIFTLQISTLRLIPLLSWSRLRRLSLFFVPAVEVKRPSPVI
jgi:hypothetical protein